MKMRLLLTLLIVFIGFFSAVGQRNANKAEMARATPEQRMAKSNQKKSKGKNDDLAKKVKKAKKADRSARKIKQPKRKKTKR